MKSRQQYLLVLFAMALLIVLMSHSVFAFSITPSQPGADTYDAEEFYNLGGGITGTTTLNPLSVTSITRGGTSGFVSTLSAAFPTWTFSSAASDLSGSFHINTYDAYGTTSKVGADFRLHYNPSGSDPTPAGDELHWIQRVVNNHKLGTGGGHGVTDDKIDIVSGQTNPFYDTFCDADEDDFHDFPWRPDASNDHYWDAELYLVELTAPNTVNIYNGVSWGWQNTVVPEPSTWLLLSTGLSGLVWFRRKRLFRGCEKI